MSLLLTSNQAANTYSAIETLAAAHIARVVADGGTVDNTDLVYAMYADLLSADVNQALVMMYGSAETGVKTSAGAVTKWYSLIGANFDMVPVSGTVTKGASGGKTCLIFSGSCMLITANPLNLIESSLVIEARSTSAAYRGVARFDGTTTIAGGSNQVGSLFLNNAIGSQAFAYTTAGGSDTLYNTYADFQRLCMVTRQWNWNEIFLDGTSVASRGNGEDATTTWATRYFKVGNSTAACAISRVFSYAGVLRPTQMKKL